MASNTDTIDHQPGSNPQAIPTARDRLQGHPDANIIATHDSLTALIAPWADPVHPDPSYAEYALRDQLEAVIADTPASTIAGIAIKLGEVIGTSEFGAPNLVDGVTARTWQTARQAIVELPDDHSRAALEFMVDKLELLFGYYGELIQREIATSRAFHRLMAAESIQARAGG